MSVVYVDLEHARVRTDAVAGEGHAQRLSVAQSRLAEAAGEACEVIRYEDVTLDGIGNGRPTAMVISGNTTDWSVYDFAELAGLIEAIRIAPVPVLGICGGHQLIGHAHGAPWGPLGVLPDETVDPDPRFAAGLRKERGFLPIEVDRSSVLFQGLQDRAVVFQSHYWHLLDVPAGFTCCASSPDSAVQAIGRRDRPVFGVQFHAERYDDAHRDGEVILRNFFTVAHTHRHLSVASTDGAPLHR